MTRRLMACITALLGTSACAGELAYDAQAFDRLLTDGGVSESVPDPTGDPLAATDVPGTPTDTPVSAPGCAEVTTLLETGCGAGACHGGDAAAASLDLVTPGIEARILDVPSTCGGALLVDSASPDDSFMLEKLEAVTPTCGGAMPLVGQLTRDELLCIRDWVWAVATGGTP